MPSGQLPRTLQPPPELPDIGSGQSTLANYLRTFSLWCRHGFADKVSGSTANPEVLLQAYNPPANTPPAIWSVQIGQAGGLWMTPLALGSGDRGTPIQFGTGTWLPLTGGTLTGPLTGTSASFSGGVTGNPLVVNAPNVGATNPIYGRINSVLRWGIFLGNGTAESGANAGSDFQINAYTDSGGGGPVGCIGITRKTGQVLISSGLNITGGGLLVTGNMVTSAIASADGFMTRAGQGAANGAYVFNHFWTGSAYQLWIGAVNAGNITVTSDYRAKKDIEPLPSMWDAVKALKPISFTFKDYTPAIELERDADALPLIVGSDEEHWGFLAHELQETLIPSAATGVKDQADAIQSPNPWTVIAALTKTVQELQARVEELEAR